VQFISSEPQLEVRDKSLGSPLPPGVLFPAAALLLSLTYMFFTILLFVGDQVGKIIQTIRTHPRNAGWLLGLYAGTYVISCSLMITGLEPTIRFDGAFVVIYLVSVMANLISLWQISNWPYHKLVNELDLDRDRARVINGIIYLPEDTYTQLKYR
jgi:hypothetical protein